MSGKRGHAYKRTATRRDHVRSGILDRQHGAENVEVKHAQELFGVEQVVRTHAAAATGICNEAIEATEYFDVASNKSGNVGFNGDIGDLMTDLARSTASLNAIDDVGESAFGPATNGDVHAVLGKTGCARCADASATTGDDC
jgi:hypothetical protein